jgi:hypothetical protein
MEKVRAVLGENGLGGHEAFEGSRAKEEASGVEKQDLDAAPRQHTCSHVSTHP